MSRLASVALLAAFCACSIPNLDKAGNIRCGTEGECPDAYECRFDHCCPASSARNVCPVFPQGSVGSPCTTPRGACTVNTGDRTVNTGVCAQFPGGYCTLTCDPAAGSATCGAFAVCVPLSGANQCARACDYNGAPAPCRDNPGEVTAGSTSRYLCLKDPFSRDPRAGVCVPDCAQSADVCATGQVCDPATHVCGAADCRSGPGAGSCEANGRSCAPSTGRCVRCDDPTAPGCAPGSTCVTTSGRCQQMCGIRIGLPPMNLTCPAGEVCRPDNVCERRH